jgi:succinate dehydrogenase/fumarate reductase flavoprotein subunit
MAGEELDLLVIGGGMAGLSAAAWSVQQGMKVMVVEKGTETGGNARYAGFVWTAPDVATILAEIPRGDPELLRAIVENVGAGVDWIRTLGVPAGEPVHMMRFGRGTPVEMPTYMATLAQVVTTAGGEIATEAHTERLLLEDGRVAGAEVTFAGASRRQVRARSTLLATGGYQNDRELTARLINPHAAQIPRRTQPRSSGDGLRLGQSAGGQFGAEGAGFYGHLVPYPVQLNDPSEFVPLSMYFSEHSLLLDQSGKRFMDETVGDHLNAQTTLEQPRGRALLVCDERVRQEWILRPYAPGLPVPDRIGETISRGGHHAKVDDLDGVRRAASEWGYDGEGVLASLADFNRQVVSDPDSMQPPRLHDRAPLDTPPYLLVEVWPAITFTQGGLLIDTQARVLDAGRSPIPGLLAAGADSGGAYVYGYAGGLALSLVTGLQAARTAATVAAAR